MIDIENTSVFGNFTGVIDDLIVYKYRNRRCIRKKPAKVKPPSSPGQVAQQERMASVAIFYQALKEVGIYPYWQKAAEGKVTNGYNLLVQQNLPAFNSNGMICDFSKIRLADGILTLPDELRVNETEEAGVWLLEWTNTPHQVNARVDDCLKLFVMKDCETFDVEPLEAAEGRRRDGQVRFRLPAHLQEYPHLYVLFCSHTTGDCSKSKYFNLIKKGEKYGNISINGHRTAG